MSVWLIVVDVENIINHVRNEWIIRKSDLHEMEVKGMDCTYCYLDFPSKFFHLLKNIHGKHTKTFYNPKRFKLNLIWVERKCENDHKWLGSVLGTLRWNSLNELRIETLCRLSINHVTCWYSRTIRPLHSHFTHLSFNEKTLSPSSHTQYEKNSGRGKVLPWKKSVRQSNEYCDEICSQFTKNQPTAYSQLLN